jgi:hypothetical protein
MVELLFKRTLLPRRRAAPDAVFAVRARASGPFQILRNGTVIYQDRDAGTVANLLMDQVTSRLAVRARDGLLLHAAAVARWGEAIVLPGGTEHGKSTLAAWLCAGEFDCLTDELVFVPEGTRTLEAFARAVRCRPDAEAILRGRFARWPPHAASLNGGASTLVPIDALRTSRRKVPRLVRRFLFARYDPAGDGVLKPLSPARSALRLLSCVLNAGHLEARGVKEAVRLARTVRAAEITYRHCAQVEAALQHWLGPEAR